MPRAAGNSPKGAATSRHPHQEQQPWLLSPSSLRSPASSVRSVSPAQEGLPRLVGRSHGVQHETAFTLAKPVGDTSKTSKVPAPPKAPLGETAEVLAKLEARITKSEATLETALAGSFKEVAHVCIHLVQQFDTLVAQIARLELSVMTGTRQVSPYSTQCETEIAHEFDTETPGKMDQETQTEDATDDGEAQHLWLPLPARDDAMVLGSPRTIRVQLEPHDLQPGSPFNGSPRGSPRAPGDHEKDLDDCLFLHHAQNHRDRSLVRPSARSAETILSGGSSRWRTHGSMASAVTIKARGLFGMMHTKSIGKHKKPRKTLGSGSQSIFSIQGWGESLSAPRTTSTALDLDLNIEGRAASLMFGLPTIGGQSSKGAYSWSYYRSNKASRMALHPRFLKFSLLVVFCNSIYLGIEAQANRAKSLYRSPWVYIIMSNLFCTFYVLEWILHLVAFRHPKYAVTRTSHLVDTVLAFVTALDIWVIEPLLYHNDATITQYYGPASVVRIVFLARFSRFVRAVPELLTLTRGLVIGTKAVFWTGVMVAILTYMFGFVMFILLRDEDTINEEMDARNFSNLENAMWTLLIDGALIEEFGVKITILQTKRRIKTTLACFVMSCYMFIANLTVLNMLIGVMNEVVNSITALEKTESAVGLMRETILKQLIKFDDGNGLISQEELECVLTDPESEAVLQSLNVDRLFLLELQQMLFPCEDSQVTVAEIVELMLLCRADSQTTVRTLASGLLYISSLFHELESRPSRASPSPPEVQSSRTVDNVWSNMVSYNHVG